MNPLGGCREGSTIRGIRLQPTSPRFQPNPEETYSPRLGKSRVPVRGFLGHGEGQCFQGLLRPKAWNPFPAKQTTDELREVTAG
jgi:hypothetical protein